MYTVQTFAHLRSVDPVDTLEFEDVKVARAKLNELGADFVCATLYRPDGGAICSNYPNMYLGSPLIREKQEKLWNARNPNWIHV